MNNRINIELPNANKKITGLNKAEPKIIPNLKVTKSAENKTIKKGPTRSGVMLISLKMVSGFNRIHLNLYRIILLIFTSLRALNLIRGLRSYPQ